MKKNILSILLGIMLLCNNFIVVKAVGVNEDLPSKYDLRDVDGKSYVTPARNQGRAGSCWAFAAMGSLESAIMKKNGGVPIKNEEEKHKGIDFIDLSEDHMDRNHGYDYKPRQGGRYECAVSYLNSRKGPYLEKDFPFGKVNSDGTYELPEKKEVTNEQIPYFVQGIQFIENVDVHTFNNQKSMLDKIKATKKAIMNYGAVSSNIYQAYDGRGTFPYTNDKYYNEATFAYYCDGKDGKYNNITNHAISIIGWDDNFSRENFKTKPKYNGAWICKEAQGDSFGDNGFYYVSYESVCVTTTQYCFKDVVKSQEGFEGIAQHETLGLTGFMGNDFSASDESDTYFNVFTAKEDCKLEAVGFYSMGNNSKYKVYVIDNFKNFSNEFDGFKSFSKIGNKYLNTLGTISNAGYSTINLSKPLNIKKGQEYAIGLWMDNSDNFNWMNLNNKKNDYVFEAKKDVNPGSKKAKINNNETYVYDEEGMFNIDGDTCTLIDTSTLVSSGIPGLKEIGNLCLKGYYNTSNKPVKDETIKEEAKINGTIDSKTNWYKSEITINAPEGYEISKDSVKWNKVIKTIDDDDYSKNGFTYYLKRLSDNVISKEMKIKFKKDVQKPLIGELSYSENKKFLDWILGKKNLEIKVPVTDDVSGAKEIKYTIKSQDGTEEIKSEIVKDGNVKIKIYGSFKGSINISAEDNAGNISENKMVGVEKKGVIVDDLAPIITIEEPKKTIENIGYAEKAILPVLVADIDKNNKISSGLKSISYSIDNEKKVNIPIDKSDTEFVKEKKFEIEVNKQGEHNISINTEDNAGNTSTESKIVKIYNKPNPVPTQEVEVNKGSAYNLKRLGGINRYLTALKIAEDINSEKLDNVVLASAINFPDALSGSVLASKYNAPILLVGKYEENNKETIAYIKEKLKKDGNIYLLGGIGVVPESIIYSLKSEGYDNFKRLGGKDRYETNLLINNELNIKKGADVIVSSSMEFADSLSISSLAGIKQMPIYITSADEIKNETLNAIKKISPNNIYITGGIGAVSNNIENKLNGIGNVIRLGGKDRYETSINIAKYFKQDTTKAVIASGLQFPDSLTGSVLAAKNNASIILVGEEVSKQKEYLDSTNIKDIYILGGTGAISEELIKNLNNINNKK